MRTFARVDLPDPFGPINACTSPLLRVRFAPFRMTLSSTCTVRSLISRSAMPHAILSFTEHNSRLNYSRTGPVSLWHGTPEVSRKGGNRCKRGVCGVLHQARHLSGPE